MTFLVRLKENEWNEKMEEVFFVVVDDVQGGVCRLRMLGRIYDVTTSCCRFSQVRALKRRLSVVVVVVLQEVGSNKPAQPVCVVVIIVSRV